MSIRKRDVHFSDWTKVRHALVCNNVQGITETSSFDDVRAFLINSESGSNPFYYYVCYIKETKEIYTHGQFYDCLKSGGSVIPEKIEELESTLGTKVDLTVFEELQSDVKENELVTARALTELNEKKADKSEIPDVSTFATKDELNTLNAEVEEKVDSTTFTTLSETVAGHTTSITNLESNKADKTDLEDYATTDNLNTKQDLLTSGTNIKTVNGNSILGSGNIETPDTKVTSAANHYGYNSDNATSTTGAFVTKITKDAANHVTSFESRALTSTDIPGLDASKITSGTIDIARLPKGALEQLHHYETKELAQQAVIDKAVQLGDTVQINHATMYICTNDSATTFATQFTEYVAGTAASVPWSGITGKPTGIDEWGNRIGVIESGYATQSWVENKGYLLSTTASSTYQPKITTNNKLAYSLISDTPTIPTKLSQLTDDVVSGKYLSINGGTVSITDIYGLSVYRTTEGGSYIHFYITQNGAKKDVGFLGVKDEDAPTYISSGGLQYPLLHSNNFRAYALPITGGTVNGSITATSFIGNLTGNADSATTVYLGNSNANGAFPVPFVSNATAGNKSLFVSTTNTLIFNPSTGGLSAKSFIGNLTGNADSATKLSNKRYIWGKEFDGTQNLTGDLKNVTRVLFDSSDKGLYKGSAFTTALTDNDAVLYGDLISLYGNVAIGGTTADEKLHIHGNVKASGSMYSTDFCTTSDNRLKDFTKDVIIDFNELKNIPKKYYYWKDKSMGEELQIGTSAQELAKVYPECVSYNEKEDRYSVSYQKLSIIALAAIDKLHERISVLEKKLNDQNS